MWIATGRTDTRNEMQGLALLVQEHLKRDPHAGDLYILRGRAGGLIKLVWHDRLGMSLCATDTMIGPIINEQQLKCLLQRIDEAPVSGARQLAGGEPQGLVLPPHVFADVTNDMPLARNEIFGPVAPVIRARGEDDAEARPCR